MQNVATQNSKAGQTAGRRCFNIVLVIHFDSANTHQSDHFSCWRNRQGDHGQYHMADCAHDHFIPPW